MEIKELVKKEKLSYKEGSFLKMAMEAIFGGGFYRQGSTRYWRWMEQDSGGDGLRDGNNNPLIEKESLIISPYPSNMPWQIWLWHELSEKFPKKIRELEDNEIKSINLRLL